MILANGNHYKVYLLDTNIVSQLLKDKTNIGSNVINHVLNDGVFCFSPYTIWELKAAENLYKEFKEIFFAIPSLIILNYPEIVKLEKGNYKMGKLNLKDVFVFLNRGYFNKGGISLEDLIDKYVKEDKLKEFRNSQDEVYSQFSRQDSIGFMEKANSATIKDIDNSVLLTAYQLIAAQEIEFAKEIRNKKEVLDVFQFPSVMSLSYLYHYKFGTRRRKGEASDISDILISSALPYVDCFITEKNVAYHLKQIGIKHNYLKTLEIFTMKDFT